MEKLKRDLQKIATKMITEKNFTSQDFDNPEFWNYLLEELFETDLPKQFEQIFEKEEKFQNSEKEYFQKEDKYEKNTLLFVRK